MKLKLCVSDTFEMPFPMLSFFVELMFLSKNHRVYLVKAF